MVFQPKKTDGTCSAVANKAGFAARRAFSFPAAWKQIRMRGTLYLGQNNTGFIKNGDL